MTHRVLISCPYFIPYIDEYAGFFKEHEIDIKTVEVRERLGASELLDIIEEFDGTLCGDDEYTPAVLEKATRLKVIAKWGTGIDSIDRVAAEKRGIQVLNTPNAFTEPVSDTVLGYMLCFARRLPWMSEQIHGGHWEKIPGRALYECTLGIVGFGNIGQAVAKRARAFGMKLLATDPNPPSEEAFREFGVERVELNDLLSQSDFISLNCDLNETSRHLVNRDRISQMKRGAILINTSRGPVVREEDLVPALDSGQIGGFASDVFEKEPIPKGHPLLGRTNCLLAPHNANSSPKTWRRVHESTLKNLVQGLENGSARG